MPFELNYNSDAQCVMVRFTGKITMSLVQEYIAALIPLLEKHNCKRILSDSRDAELQLSSLDIMQFPKMAEASPLTARCKRALLAAPGTSGYEMYETLSQMQGHKVRVFSNPDDAMTWLLTENEEQQSE